MFKRSYANDVHQGGTVRSSTKTETNRKPGRNPANLVIENKMRRNINKREVFIAGDKEGAVHKTQKADQASRIHVRYTMRDRSSVRHFGLDHQKTLSSSSRNDGSSNLSEGLGSFAPNRGMILRQQPLQLRSVTFGRHPPRPSRDDQQPPRT